MDSGDLVIIVNADKVVLTVRQGRHQARPPPHRLPRRPQDPHLRRAPGQAPRRSHPPHGQGHDPKGRLGAAQITKLKVYAGPHHPHAAQQPAVLALPDARRSIA